MERYSLREAQDHLQQLIDDAQHGKTVLIRDEHDQTVQLVPLTTSDAGIADNRPRKAGSARGLIKMVPDFDEPLADFSKYME